MMRLDETELDWVNRLFSIGSVSSFPSFVVILLIFFIIYNRISLLQLDTQVIDKSSNSSTQSVKEDIWYLKSPKSEEQL